MAGAMAKQVPIEPPSPVRSRWTPKPEKILILESIFNSGMVNPPKDETVRIRKIIEKFGAVGDANVFYWFQNRRSRSRRRQRQLQAGLMAEPRAAMAGTRNDQLGAILYEPASCGGGFFPCSSSASSCQGFVGHDSADDLFSITRQMGFVDNTPTSSIMCSTDVSQLHYQPGTVTVFINGIASEVPGSSINLRDMFGPDMMLVHSSGQILPVNEDGILLQTLQMGESYFLISGTANSNSSCLDEDSDTGFATYDT